MTEVSIGRIKNPELLINRKTPDQTFSKLSMFSFLKLLSVQTVWSYLFSFLFFLFSWAICNESC